MKKYYTPEIEELYVGFECQHTTNMSAFKINDTDRIYNSPLIIHELCDYITWSLEEGLDKFVRVKYLDQEDIESLGWEYIETLTLKGTRLRYSFNNFILDYIPSNNLLALLEDNFSCRFNCVLKNKSELRKLMKQLNII